jgi:hypothetical protein
MQELIVTRPGEATDVGFIYSTWLKGLYYGNDWFRAIPQELYYDHYHQVIEKLLFNSTTTVACLSEDPDVIIGYAVYSKDTLHWVFVKNPWRKLGVAKKLIPDNIKRVTHLTILGKKLLPETWVFDPFT